MKTIEDINYVRQWFCSQNLKLEHKEMLDSILFYAKIEVKAKRKGRSRIQRRHFINWDYFFANLQQPKKISVLQRLRWGLLV